MLCGLAQHLLHVFGQQVAGLYESLGCLSHLFKVIVSGRIALRNGASGISSRLAHCAGCWERKRRPHQGAARRPTGGQGLTCPTDVSMAQIPAGVGCQGHRLEGQANPTDFIAVLVNSRHQARIGPASQRRHMGGYAFLGPEVKARKASQGLWKVDARDSPESGGELLRRYCCAISEAGMATGWG